MEDVFGISVTAIAQNDHLYIYISARTSSNDIHRSAAFRFTRSTRTIFPDDNPFSRRSRKRLRFIRYDDPNDETVWWFLRVREKTKNVSKTCGSIKNIRFFFFGRWLLDRRR